jgi:hypothetical protein
MSWTDELTRRKDDKNKLANDIKNQVITLGVSLSPMVSSVLIELGKSLWGKGLLGYKYYLWSSGDISSHYADKSGIKWVVSNKSKSHTYRDDILVSLSSDMKYLEVHGTEVQDGSTGKYTKCSSHDLSEQGLKEALLTVCEKNEWYPKS